MKRKIFLTAAQIFHLFIETKAGKERDESESVDKVRGVKGGGK